MIMKFKLTVLLATFVVTMGLLLGASAAQAQVSLEGDTATGIQNLDVGGTLYNVAFLSTTATDLYGPAPNPIFDFPGDSSAYDALESVNAALNASIAERVGPSSDEGSRFYNIGWQMRDDVSIDTKLGQFSLAWVEEIWSQGFDDEVIYADFTSAGPPPDQVAIGGSVTGLVGSGLVLQNNGGDDLTIAAADSGFEFAARVNVGDPYEVTVFTQPEGQICSVTNGSDVAPDVNVTNVEVDCVNEPEVTIGGWVFGLESDSFLVLGNNETDYLLISENGDFTFDDSLTPGDPYDVTVFTTVFTLPDGQTCSVRNGNDVAPDVNVTNVFVFCGDEPDPVTIGGGVFGLASDSFLVLGNNLTDYLLIIENRDFTFEDRLMPGDSYDVSVFFVYPEQICSVSNGSGVAHDVNVTNVAVACGPAADPVTIGGTVNGLESDSGLVLQNNLTDDKPIAADGEFTFDEPLQQGGTYSVTVLANPINPAQECHVDRESGPVGYEDITNVAVTCAPSDPGPPPPDLFTVCTQGLCGQDEALQDQCDEFMAICLLSAGGHPINQEKCLAGAFLLCEDIDFF